MKCIICYKDADVTFQANTFCKEHFELCWAYVCQKINGRSIAQMKEEFEKSKVEIK